MSRRIIVHIGTYKTGSTSIQQALWGADNPDDGDDSASFRYARTGLHPRLHKHLPLYDAVISTPANADRALEYSYDDLARELRAELEAVDDRTVIISEEELSFPSHELAEAYRFLSDHGQVQVVMYVRRQDRFLDSLYRQFASEVARHVTIGFDEFVAQDLERQRGDFDAVLAPWAEVFGASCLVVRDFDVVRTTGLLDDFAGIAGIDLGDADPTRLHNLSFRADVIEVLRRLSSRRPQLMRHRLGLRIHELVGDGIDSYLDDATSRRILEGYADANARLLANHGVDLGGYLDEVDDDTTSPEQLRAQIAEQALELAVTLLDTSTPHIVRTIERTLEQQAHADDPGQQDPVLSRAILEQS